MLVQYPPIWTNELCELSARWQLAYEYPSGVYWLDYNDEVNAGLEDSLRRGKDLLFDLGSAYKARPMMNWVQNMSVKPHPRKQQIRRTFAV